MASHAFSQHHFVSAALLLLPQAVGLGLHYVKLGGPSGAERMTKYNQLISIEEELAQQGMLGMFLPPPLFFLFFFFSRTEKEEARQSRERVVVMPELENTSLSLSVYWM